MTATIRSEWTKLRTQRGTLIALAAMCALMVGITALFASENETDAVTVGNDDLVQNGLSGVVFAQLAAVVVGASLVTSEHSTGMLRTTLTATQSRLRVLLAKAIVLVLAVFPLALLASAASFVVAQELMRDRGFVAPAYPPVELTDGPAARAVAGTALLLAAYALAALGLGTILRHAGVTIAAGIALFFMPILTLGAFPDDVRTRIEQVTPLAGMAIQSTTGRMLSAFDGTDTMPIGPWQGLGVAFAWAAGALVLGYLLLRTRDA